MFPIKLSNHAFSEAMHNVSAHQLPQYYQLQQVPYMVWTALVTFYILWRWQITLDCWDAKIASWYSPSATCQICLYCLKYGFRMHVFRSILSCLNIKVLAIWVKFLKPFSYWTVNCTFTFHTTVLVTSAALWPISNCKVSSQIRLYCTFICAAFKSLIE